MLNDFRCRGSWVLFDKFYNVCLRCIVELFFKFSHTTSLMFKFLL